RILSAISLLSLARLGYRAARARGRPGLLRRRIASRDPAVDDPFREVAAALVDELEYRADLAHRVEPRYRLVVPGQHAALRVGAQPALRVRAAGVERDRVERRRCHRSHGSRLALEIGIVAGGAVTIPARDRLRERGGVHRAAVVAVLADARG